MKIALVVPGGVDRSGEYRVIPLKVWQPREPVRRDLSKPARLIHTASLNRIKDQPTLLRALKRVRFQEDADYTARAFQTMYAALTE